MNNLLNIFIWTTLSIAMGLMLYTIFLLNYPVEAISVNVQPSVVQNKEVKAGEELVFFLDYCRHTDNVSVINRSLRGKQVFHYEPFTTVGKKGCTVLEVHVAIPSEVTPGIYYLQSVNETQVNPLRKIVTPFETEPFTII